MKNYRQRLPIRHRNENFRRRHAQLLRYQQGQKMIANLRHRLLC